MKAANITSNVADRLNYVSEAERRLLATVPRTTAWFDAQRDAVHARADYWDAMCEKWDFSHPELASSRRPLQVI
jgi:hypothetical protein